MCGIVGVLVRNWVNEESVRNDLRSLCSHLKLLEGALKNGVNLPSDYLALVRAQFANLQGFPALFLAGCDPGVIRDLVALKDKIARIGERIDQMSAEAAGGETGATYAGIERLNSLRMLCRDGLWTIEKDILGALPEVQELNRGAWARKDHERVLNLWRIDYVLRNIGRIEVRGRDSAGIAVLAAFPDDEARRQFDVAVEARGLGAALKERRENRDFTAFAVNGDGRPGYILSYKVAREIGRMGENIAKLRHDIRQDEVLDALLSLPGVRINVLAHTRWASNGVISEPNAHPQDNRVEGEAPSCGRISAVLNGDIDNYQALYREFTELTGRRIADAITTDAKIIPLFICERHEKTGDFAEGFRQAVNRFEGSFAIAAHHLDEPEKIYLALRGSGQSLYIGIRNDTLVAASELYGIVEATPSFIKMDGEWVSDTGAQGQIVVLDQAGIGTVDAVRSMSFDGTALPAGAFPVKEAEITTRDICLGDFSHYFLKEIHDSVASVRKTLRGRYTLGGRGGNGAEGPRMLLDETVVPERVLEGLKSGRIRTIYCIGQGTAAVAAAGIAPAIARVLEPLDVTVSAMKATELSGYLAEDRMDDCLIVAVSQSGTTCDTNRTVDVARSRGASCIAIVNRRNSDLVYKCDGVLYTSDGRDVEMAVASTKAFYAQVVAGTLLALHLGFKTGAVAGDALRRSLEALERLPGALKDVLASKDEIRRAAERFAPGKLHWAIAGSGPNHIAAQELRIKLSELCYKSIACDFLEDKKHVDLSSEPFILVCAAGLDSVNLADAVKEVAIFKAHRSVPVVFATEGAERFAPYAAAVVRCPAVGEGLDFIPEVMAGHLFGFYAAAEIDRKANPLRALRTRLVDMLPRLSLQDGTPATFAEVGELLELREVEEIERGLLMTGEAAAALESGPACRLALLLKYLQGRLPIDDVTADFGIAATPRALIETSINALSAAINQLTRPIDAIKHQAKTVTVGITREELKLSGALAAAFAEAGVNPALVSRGNLEVLIALEPLIEKVAGASLYRVKGLSSKGLPDERSTLERMRATGEAAALASRTDRDPSLKGTKWLCVKDRKVFLGRGRSDSRPVAIVPLGAEGGAREDRGAATGERGLLLLHVAFKTAPDRGAVARALKRYNFQYDRIVAAATEVNGAWDEGLLQRVPVADLFDESLQAVMEGVRAGNEDKK